LAKKTATNMVKPHRIMLYWWIRYKHIFTHKCKKFCCNTSSKIKPEKRAKRTPGWCASL